MLCSMFGTLYDAVLNSFISFSYQFTDYPWGISRYLTTILDGPQNPHYMDVRRDIISAILSKKVERASSQPATYQLCNEQKQALQGMYSKWLSRCSVWSQASKKV